MRVLFWGTPEFALPSLRALLDAGHEVAGVVTRPDAPRGRGRRVLPSPVRAFAEARGLTVLTPGSPSGDAFEKTLRALEPDASAVVAYGRILDRRVLDVPTKGSFNLHASLLPELRGAAPVSWAIVRGHAETGATVMRMVEEMDAGPVLAQARLEIGAADTASGLAAALSKLGASLLAATLARIEAGPVPEREQDHRRATYAPRIDRAAARVDWRRSPREVADLIRGMDAVPGAWTRLAGAPVKLFAPRVLRGASGAGQGPGPAPGEIVGAGPRLGLTVATGARAEGRLRVGEVQPAGRKRMTAAAWLRGSGPRVGERFEPAPDR